MKIVKAFIGDGQFVNLKLSTDIDVCSDIVELDLDKLNSILKSTRDRVSNVFGVYSYSEGRITFFNNGKFSCKIWADNNQVNGTWTTLTEHMGLL